MENKNIVASIEARMTSSRLPGKVLMEAIDGISMLEFMIERVKKSNLIDQVIVATTVNGTDDPIVELCNKLSINCYRGSEEDVLLRVLNAHKSVNSQIIVQLTGDCPLIDPEIVDKVIDVYLNNSFDFVSNGHVRSYPDGLDVGVFSVDLLDEVSTKTEEPYDREHVTAYIYRSGEYSLKSVVADKALYWSDLRITLDDVGDYDLIKKIVRHFYSHHNLNFTALDMIEYIRANPKVLALNKDARVNVAPYQEVAQVGDDE